MKTNSQGESRLTYIDATIPSYLVSRPSRSPETAERQKITREFWQDTRFEFILSDYVIDEISIGNRDQATNRLRAVEGLSILIVQNADRVLAQRLVDQGALPQIAFTDAVHIAVSARRAIPYLVTWNFAHLANPHTKPKIGQVCSDAGYSPPRIDTPEAILEELNVRRRNFERMP